MTSARPSASRAPLPASLGLALAGLAVIGSALGGCGAQAPQQNNQIPAANLQAAQALARDSRLTCATPGNCPASVGLLTAAEETQATLCTSFLIAPDLVATNSHCIPKDLKAPGSSCHDRIWVRFASSGAASDPGERRGCKVVLSASVKKRADDPDYAFLQLDQPTTRAPLAVSHAGFADGAQYLVSKINPLAGDKAEGLLEQYRCRAPQRSIVSPAFDNDLASDVTLADCVFVHGNSGSPLTDGDGRVRGVVYAHIDEAALIKEELTTDERARMKEELAPLGAATSFACLQLPSEDPSQPLPKQCAALSPRSLKRATDQSIEKARKKSQKTTIQQWLASGASPQGASSFEWAPREVYTTTSDTSPAPTDAPSFIAVPRCLKPGASPAPQLPSLVPQWCQTHILNRYLQDDYVATPCGTRQSTDSPMPLKRGPTSF